MKRQLLTLSLLCSASIFCQAQTAARAASASRRADFATSSVQSARPVTSAARMNQSILNEATEQAPELFPGEMQDVGPQYLVVDRAPQHRWVQLYLDSQYFYTSNALLTEKGNSDTGLMISTFEGSINLPPFTLLGGAAAVRAGYRHQMWLYSLDSTANQLNNVDFDVSTVFLGFNHAINENWSATLGLDYNRYLSHDASWAEFYIELMPNWSVQRTFSFGEKTTLSMVYAGAYHWTQTDPDPVQSINDRLDTTLAAALNYQIIDQLFLQGFYRFQWSHYTVNSDRNDTYNTLGLGLYYAFAEWGGIKASVTYENRNSTDDIVADYTKWDTGGGLSFVFQF